MACHPEIPVGGRLIYFLKKWEQITDDQWVLSVIKEGYKLEFLEIPKNTGIKYTCVSAKDLDILDTEVSTKRSCRICTSERNRKRFLQHIFSCPQENRGH